MWLRSCLISLNLEWTQCSVPSGPKPLVQSQLLAHLVFTWAPFPECAPCVPIPCPCIHPLPCLKRSSSCSLPKWTSQNARSSTQPFLNMNCYTFSCPLIFLFFLVLLINLYCFISPYRRIVSRVCFVSLQLHWKLLESRSSNTFSTKLRKTQNLSF